MPGYDRLEESTRECLIVLAASLNLLEALKELLRAAELVEELPAGDLEDTDLHLRALTGGMIWSANPTEDVNCRILQAEDCQELTGPHVPRHWQGD